MTEKGNTDHLIKDFFYNGNECPVCKTGFELKNSTSQYYGCPKCSTFFNIKDTKNYRKINASFRRKKPSIPIGKKGEIEGIEYEVIGFTHCREDKSIFEWNEYYLFSEKSNKYAYLSESDGHWIFIQDFPDAIKPKIAKSIIYDEKEFRLFNKYRPKILLAEGEFDSNIVNEYKPLLNEYIHPPYLLTFEKTDKSTDQWLYGKSIENSFIKKAFNLPYLPSKSGVGMVQPNNSSFKLSALYNLSAIGLALLILVHLFFYDTKSADKNKIVFSQKYYIEDKTIMAVTPIVSPSFKIESTNSKSDNIEIEIEAPISNSWFEVQLALINDVTGEEYSIETGVEYYSGPDWSEGGQRNHKLISNVPNGTYHLNIFPFQDTSKQIPYFKIKLTKGVEMWSNLFIILLVILGFPIFKYYRNSTIENNRWSNSNYAE